MIERRRLSDFLRIDLPKTARRVDVIGNGCVAYREQKYGKHREAESHPPSLVLVQPHYQRPLSSAKTPNHNTTNVMPIRSTNVSVAGSGVSSPFSDSGA